MQPPASPPPPAKRLRVVHILSGDRWAGAEVQVFTLLSKLVAQTDLHVLLMNDGELAAKCQSMGIATTIFDESKMSGWQLFKSIRNKLKELQPDIVHTHRQKENIFGSVANATTHRAKCVRTVHGAPEFTPTGKQRIQVWLDRLCGHYLQDAIIAVSEDLRLKLIEAFPERKLHVILNGIDAEEIKSSATTPDFRQSAPNAVHVGLVGRLDPVKRVDLFLEMAAILLNEKPDTPWMFHVFGEGRQENSMKSLARDLGVNNCVLFHGHRSDIRSCISGLDAVVMPSDHEGLPMAALETIALKVRLVAHNTGGLIELLRNSSHFPVIEHSARGYACVLSDAVSNQKSMGAIGAEYLASTNSRKICSLYGQLKASEKGIIDENKRIDRRPGT